MPDNPTHDNQTTNPITMGSIRESGTSPRAPRQDLTPRQDPTARQDPTPRLAPPMRHEGCAVARAPRSRPDPNPLRLMIGLAGLASAAAFTTAMLPSVTPKADAAQATDQPVAAAVEQPSPSVLHVTRYVTLKPGETAPPQATVVVPPQPTPTVTVRVVTKTRQSGKP